MQRVKTPFAVADKPPYDPTGAPGYFSSGNPLTAQPPTVPGAQWFNMTQEELCNLILAAGLELDPEDDTQLAQAVQALIAAQNVTVSPATESTAGIIKMSSAAQALAGEDDSTAMSPADVAAAIAGVVRAYTRQQSAAPVARTGQSGSQAVDMDLHQLLSITATGALSFAAPSNLAVGKTAIILVYSASAVALTYDAAYLGSSAFALPGSTTAGKWLVMNFFCHKAGSLLLTGVVEEA